MFRGGLAFLSRRLRHSFAESSVMSGDIRPLKRAQKYSLLLKIFSFETKNLFQKDEKAQNLMGWHQFSIKFH